MKFFKKWLPVFLLIIVLLYIIIIKIHIWPRVNDIEDVIEVTTNKVKGGYGYTLSKNHKILITQKYIPAIQNKRVFCTVEDANKVANLVRYKIVRKEDPTVSLEELKKMKINFNCVNLH